MISLIVINKVLDNEADLKFGSVLNTLCYVSFLRFGSQLLWTHRGSSWSAWKERPSTRHQKMLLYGSKCSIFILRTHCCSVYSGTCFPDTHGSKSPFSSCPLFLSLYIPICKNIIKLIPLLIYMLLSHVHACAPCLFYLINYSFLITWQPWLVAFHQLCSFTNYSSTPVNHIITTVIHFCHIESIP